MMAAVRGDVRKEHKQTPPRSKRRPRSLEFISSMSVGGWGGGVEFQSVAFKVNRRALPPSSLASGKVAS